MMAEERKEGCDRILIVVTIAPRRDEGGGGRGILGNLIWIFTWKKQWWQGLFGMNECVHSLHNMWECADDQASFN